MSSSISQSELERLKLAQFHHREAIYQTNQEGEFASKRVLARMAESAARTASSLDHRSPDQRRSRQQQQPQGASLSPLERIHRDLRQADRNRVASAEELKAAVAGPSALRKLHKKRSEEAAAVAAVQAMGFEVRRVEAPLQQDSRSRAPPANQSEQAALAHMQAMSAAYWAESAAMASASSSSSACAAAPVPSPSAAAAAAATPRRKDKERDGNRERDDADSSHKKKKKKKEKGKDGVRDSSSSRKKKKHDKKRDKEKEKAHASLQLSSPSGAGAGAVGSSSSSVSAAASASASAAAAGGSLPPIVSPRTSFERLALSSGGGGGEWSVSRGGGAAIDEDEVHALLS